MTVALVGNPNCGKSTLFNALTGAHRAVGNWSGVTVDMAGAAVKGMDNVTLIDLPGAYSLKPRSMEERVTRDFLLSGRADAIVNIADATNLQRHLRLTLALARLNLPMVTALNMTDELKRAGGYLDEKALSLAVGVPMARVCARTGEGFDGLRALIKTIAPPRNARPYTDEAGEEKHIDACLRAAKYVKSTMRGRAATDKIDDWLLHPRFAYLFLLLITALMFLIAFGRVGAFFSVGARAVMEAAEGAIAYLLRQAGAPEWARGVVLGGAVAGIGSVIVFLPQLMLMFLFMELLEDSGYMARAAFIADRPMRALGLSGRSVIPLLMGFGCTTAAISAARALKSDRDRRMTVMLTPFMSCGAKLPVYALFTAAFFPQSGGLIVFLLYLLGVLCMIPCACLLRKTVFRAGEAPFFMELPPYRIPTARSFAKRLFRRTGEFLYRAGTLILAASVLVWTARYFTPAFASARTLSESIFGRVGALIAPALSPLGFGTGEAAVSLLSGLIAKEAVVSTLQILYAAADANALTAGVLRGFASPAAAFAYLAFVVLYTPCASAMAAMRRALGSRRETLCVLAGQLLIAWAVSFLIYRLGSLLC